MKCKNCTREAQPGMASCTSCSERGKAAYRRRIAAGLTGTGYDPIDRVLSEPSVRILRALRHFDSCSCSELFEVLDVPAFVPNGENLVRNNYTKQLSQLRARGMVERLGSKRCGVSVFVYGFNWYRITDKGRAWLSKRLAPDTNVLWSDNRRSA